MEHHSRGEFPVGGLVDTSELLSIRETIQDLILEDSNVYKGEALALLILITLRWELTVSAGLCVSICSAHGRMRHEWLG